MTIMKAHSKSTTILLSNYTTEKEKIINSNSLSIDEKYTQIDSLLEKYGHLPIGESKNEIHTTLLLKEIELYNLNN